MIVVRKPYEYYRVFFCLEVLLVGDPSYLVAHGISPCFVFLLAFLVSIDSLYGRYEQVKIRSSQRIQ